MRYRVIRNARVAPIVAEILTYKVAANVPKINPPASVNTAPPGKDKATVIMKIKIKIIDDKK